MARGPSRQLSFDFHGADGRPWKPRGPRYEGTFVQADCSEEVSGVPEMLAGLGAEVESLRLPRGDYLVQRRVLIERKASGDFAQSLFDGRLFRQASYLCRGVAAPLIVVEGRAAHFESLWPRPLQGALLAILVGLRLPIAFTRGPEATARLILEIARRCLADPAGGSLAPCLARPPAAEGGRADPRGRMLECLPRVGPVLASRLLERFKTIEAIVGADPGALRSVEGVGAATARLIHEALHQQPGRPADGKVV